MSLLTRITDALSNHTNHARLTEVRPIGDFTNEQQLLLRGLYGAADSHTQLSATLVNALVTQKRTVFFFSRPSLEGLLAADVNTQHSTKLNGETFISLLVGLEQFLSRIAVPERGTKKATVFEVTDPELLALIGVSAVETERQREQCLRLFHSKKAKSSNVLSNKSSNVLSNNSSNVLSNNSSTELEIEYGTESGIEPEDEDEISVKLYSNLNTNNTRGDQTQELVPRAVSGTSSMEARGEVAIQAAEMVGEMKNILDRFESREITIQPYENEFLQEVVSSQFKFHMNGLKTQAQRNKWSEIRAKYYTVKSTSEVRHETPLVPSAPSIKGPTARDLLMRRSTRNSTTS
ncbi:MAG: hypothetical protein EOP09_00200 [Proteobacteria bacterium]|nr:MAG: hypothetical protein EOP09_00200 [Pseudomonadota bacterium]